MVARNRRHWKGVALVLAAFFAATFAGATVRRLLKSSDAQGPGTPVLGAGRINGSLEQREIRVVYIGRSSCAWCTSPELKTALESLRALLRARNDSLGVRGSFHGVAVDLDPDLGVSHLKHLAPFDEVGSGRGWSSAAAEPYVTGPFAGPLATPQLLVIARRLQFPDSTGTGLPLISDERLLTRKIGLMEIVAWIREGARLVSSEGLNASPIARGDSLGHVRSR